MGSYFSRGRHRAPTHTARKVAAFTTAVAVPGVAAVGYAHAATDPDWGPIIACESGGNPTAQNPSSTASGLYQFLDSSWIAYGGGKYSSRAKDASVAQQTEIANRAYAQSGYTPWDASKSCWGGKIGSGSAPVIRDVPKPPVAAELTVTAVAPEAAPTPVVLPAEAQPGPFTDGEYEIRPGDTLSAIAVEHNVPGGWNALYEKNRNVVEHPDWIWPGERINLS